MQKSKQNTGLSKPELISPAGDLEKLKIAFQYGADAVYGSTPNFSMRTRDIGFTYETLEEGIDFAHAIGKKVYLTLNIYPHAFEIENLKKHTRKLISLKPDAIIAADPGIIRFLKENSDIPVHLSTQANATNQLAVDFWAKQGIERIVLARELSIKEIAKISETLRTDCHANSTRNDIQKSDSTMKQWSNEPIGLEAFVHGSMCMAYSGRCQISNYLTGRDPNRGSCVQACRFNYKLREYTLEEEKRPGEEFPIYEDERGTHFFNSKDLCMIEHLAELVVAGVSSFKIEGRLKSIYYVGAVTRAYRQAIDLLCDRPDEYTKQTLGLRAELDKVSNRGFTTGFYFNKPTTATNNYESSKPTSEWGYVGLTTGYDQASKRVLIEGKNQLKTGTQAEFVTPTGIIPTDLSKIWCKGKEVPVVHAGYHFELDSAFYIPKNSFLRSNVKQPISRSELVKTSEARKSRLKATK